MEQSTVHQLVFLQPKLMVSWKCLSLQAFENLERQPADQFAPVGYASRSDRFFSDLVNRGLLRGKGDSPAAVLWVISCPKFKLKGVGAVAFPPTLTAKIVVDEVVTGDRVRDWGSGGDLDLRPPTIEGDALEAWRRAVSVKDPRERAAFRITRDHARLSWKRGRKANRRFTQLDAWKSIRTAIANPDHSKFLAHADATACLGRIFERPDLVDLPLDDRSRQFAWQLMSPRRISPKSLALASELEEIAESGSENTVFLSYRWNERMQEVADIGLEFLKQGYGIWLDRLQIPDLKTKPVWRQMGKTQRKGPPQIDLERLLHNAIERSSLFLGLAADDYERSPKDNPKGENWAQKERQYANDHLVGDKQKIGLIDLGGVPNRLKPKEKLQWRYDGSSKELFDQIIKDAGLTR